MRTDQATEPEHENQREKPKPPAIKRSRWWREVLIIAAFYGLYTLVRDIRGTRPVSALQAFTNAKRLIHSERWLGIFHEADVQHFFLPDRWLIELCDDFYDSIHFIAAIGVLVLLFFWFPSRYRLWRNTLAITTGLALIGFFFFPLMPPRLLPPGYHFVDTLKVVGGFWNFSQGPANDVSNQYAAMPSLHTAWAVWSAAAVSSLARRWWTKILPFLYPAATIFTIVVTGNHYFGDVIAGLVLLAAAFLVAGRMDRLSRSRARMGANATSTDASGATLG
ncbi:MAG: phosphatase PAP2 family protein [Acidimicrobiales bacterium]|nr:phosphatase PAP2 family protein [Acidimicrobiales bacterium]